MTGIFQCKRCGIILKTKVILQRHFTKAKLCEPLISDLDVKQLLAETKIRNYNSQTKTYDCLKCGKQFNNSRNKCYHQKKCTVIKQPVLNNYDKLKLELQEEMNTKLMKLETEYNNKIAEITKAIAIPNPSLINNTNNTNTNNSDNSSTNSHNNNNNSNNIISGNNITNNTININNKYILPFGTYDLNYFIQDNGKIFKKLVKTHKYLNENTEGSEYNHDSCAQEFVKLASFNPENPRNVNMFTNHEDDDKVNAYNGTEFEKHEKFSLILNLIENVIKSHYYYKHIIDNCDNNDLIVDDKYYIVYKCRRVIDNINNQLKKPGVMYPFLKKLLIETKFMIEKIHDINYEVLFKTAKSLNSSEQ